MSTPLLPHAMPNVSHYHQAPGIHPRPRTVPAGIELVELVTAGRGWVRHAGELAEVTPGALIWHVAGDTTIERSDFAAPYRCLAIVFRVADSGQRRVPHLSRWRSQDEVKAFTREVVRDSVDDQFDQQVLMVYAFGRLLYQARVYHHRRLSSDAPANLLRALDFVESRYAEALTVEVLAAEAGWSAAHLHAVFRETLGITPHQHLMRRRLQAAKELLTSTDQPIKQIALACGYASVASFTRQFRQATELTPGAYRRQTAYAAVRGPRRPPTSTT